MEERISLTAMKKFFFPFLAVITLPMLSCTGGNSDEPKPLSLTSDESDLPWNRPTGPEGGGPLGLLNR